MAIVQERRPRFRREPDQSFRVTARDAELVRHVYRHRFLRSTHLVALAGGSSQQMLRRLQLLYHHRYLDRPPIQLEYYARGSKPMVYALGDRGADLLSEHFHIPRGKIRWSAKNQALTRVFLNHTLLIADVMVALELACRESGRVRLIPAEEIIQAAPSDTRRKRNPSGWSVEVRDGGETLRFGVIPDKIFGLHFLDKPDGKNRAFFFLEADRASMPIMRAKYNQTSFYRKMLAYRETWQQKIHTRQFGIKSFRVLTVTSLKERVENLLAANARLDGAAGLFLFTDEESLKGADILTHAWKNGRGEETRLSD